MRIGRADMIGLKYLIDEIIEAIDQTTDMFYQQKVE